ncbi:MAG: coenzyme F420-0:L-glutamate ligase [Chloroflexi bacterium RBG_13_51_18]|nr:MAG: coenzyme F420-0:L-glutamate ligase [Chloroflexi bacterium RBG_13_51_18]
MYAVPNIPLIKAGDDIAQIIYKCAKEDKFGFENRDIVVVTHKIVSKAENACVKLSEITPSVYAKELAEKTGRDPRLCQVYVNESKEILGINGRHIVTRHRLGFVGTGAGVDTSNMGILDEEIVCLLPRDPDASARKIRSKLKELSGKELAVIICDTYGNEYRKHSINFAVGIAGIHPYPIGDTVDLYDRPKKSSTAQVDEIAAAAGMMMGQANERIPVVVVRGVEYKVGKDVSIKDILT